MGRYEKAILTEELRADPKGLGYAAFLDTGDDQAIANKLNQIQPTIVIRRADITVREVLEAIDLNDVVKVLSPIALSWFEAITSLPTLRLERDDGSPTMILTNLMSLLTPGSASQTRLLALARRPGSRAEQLFGAGVGVSALDVADALGRG